MDNIIEQLYLGTLNPQSLADTQNSRTAELITRIVELEQQLTNRLQSEDKKLFLHLCDLWSEQFGNDRISTFTTGFQLGARFSMDIIFLVRFVRSNITYHIFHVDWKNI